MRGRGKDQRKISSKNWKRKLGTHWDLNPRPLVKHPDTGTSNQRSPVQVPVQSEFSLPSLRHCSRVPATFFVCVSLTETNVTDLGHRTIVKSNLVFLSSPVEPIELNLLVVGKIVSG